MADKLDYKKEYKDLYMPGKTPMRILVPQMHFIAVDGQGAPEGEEYQAAISALYALSFTIKMSKMGTPPPGYFEYVVPPLEGLWWSGDPAEGRLEMDRRADWHWTAMIRQPEFVTPEVFSWAAEECRRKKPEISMERARFFTYAEGECVQVMHMGPYSAEEASMEKLAAFMEQNGLRSDLGTRRRHHEIYLSDPRRTAPERLKTVLRTPVREK